jgi:predicted dehydrogenase
MKTTSIGVIGCGYWGPNLLRNFAENEAGQLRWICDVDEVRLASMSRRYPFRANGQRLPEAAGRILSWMPSRWSRRWRPITRLPGHVCRPGKHVLMEKPLTATIAEAEELIELAERQASRSWWTILLFTPAQSAR